MSMLEDKWNKTTSVLFTVDLGTLSISLVKEST